eukprot:gene4812-8398_t
MEVESETRNRKNLKKKKKIHPNTNGRVRVSKACLSCRSRHQRCGFERPCKHCKEAGIECRDSNYSQPKPSKIFPAIQKIQKPNLLPPFQNGTVLVKQFNSVKKNQVQLPKILNINQYVPTNSTNENVLINTSINVSNSISRCNERMNIKSSLLNQNENGEIVPKTDKIIEEVSKLTEPTLSELVLPQKDLLNPTQQGGMEYIITPQTPNLDHNSETTLNINDTKHGEQQPNETDQNIDSSKFSVLSNIVDNLPNDLPLSDISTGISQLPNAPVVENFSQDLNNSTTMAPQPLNHMPEPLLLETSFQSTNASLPEQEKLNISSPIHNELNSNVDVTKENEQSEQIENKLSADYYPNFNSEPKLSPTPINGVGDSFDKLFESVEKSKIQ